MLETILDRQILFVLMGIVAALGVISKAVVSISLRSLTRAAENMGKSAHPLMRLVRAKYEHACMVSDRVQNAEVFVEKYIHEYRKFGVSLHGWRRLERASAWVCAAIGVLEAAGEYFLRGMSDRALWYAGVGVGAGILLFLLRISMDEKYRLQVIRTYMVDYLDNFCARKCEKARGRGETTQDPEWDPELFEETPEAAGAGPAGRMKAVREKDRAEAVAVSAPVRAAAFAGQMDYDGMENRRGSGRSEETESRRGNGRSEETESRRGSGRSEEAESRRGSGRSEEAESRRGNSGSKGAGESAAEIVGRSGGEIKHSSAEPRSQSAGVTEGVPGEETKVKEALGMPGMSAETADVSETNRTEGKNARSRERRQRREQTVGRSMDASAMRAESDGRKSVLQESVSQEFASQESVSPEPVPKEARIREILEEFLA